MNLVTLKNLQVPQNNPYGDKYKTDKDFCLGDIIKVNKDKYLVTNIEDIKTASQGKYLCPDLNTLLPEHYTLIRGNAICTGGGRAYILYKDKAREWIMQGGELKNAALECYDLDELIEFTDIWLNTPREKENIEMNPKHREYLETIAQIKAVADYLNGDWEPKINEEKYCIKKLPYRNTLDGINPTLVIRCSRYEYVPGVVYYKSKETAEIALAVLKHKYESL
jgi:hypothetical protein